MVIKHFNMESISEQRRRGYLRWLSFFKQGSGIAKAKIVFPDLREGVVPYVFPVLADDQKQFIFEMHEKGVESFPWPFLPQGSQEGYLSRHMVCLPVLPCFDAECFKKIIR
jgi:hypothetical protein